MKNSTWRRGRSGAALLLAVLMVAGCSGSNTASPEPVVTVSVTSQPPGPASTGSAPAPETSGTSVTVAPATPTISATGAPVGSDVVTTVAPSTPVPSTTAPPAVPVAVVTSTPAFGATDMAPAAPVTITASGGTITEITVTNPDGKEITGELAADGSSWTLGEVLGYGRTYTVSGTAVNAAGATTAISGTYETVTPDTRVRTTVSPGDGAVVGVAAPVVVTFGVEPEDRAAIERSVSITTTPEVEGAWAWIQHDGGLWALDWRPREYWPANTEVHVEANVYGQSFGGGNWGGDDLTSDFTIGRNQVVKADVNSHELVVYRDGKEFASFDASYGRGTDRDTTTRSGIHVITEMFDEKLMSNPKYGYTNVLERYAVRISNNGEFIHANPGTVDSQGNTNVSHGCVNLSLDHAKEFMESSLSGDPVEVTGTDVPLSAEDGDVYDWTYSWEQWQTFSALS